MNIIISIILILIVYWKIKNQYAKRIKIKYQYMLYDLRDKLRELAVKGKINKNDWRFKYLDGSISKCVHELSYINLISIILLAKKYQGDKNFQSNKSKVMEGIKENEYSAIIYEEYGLLLFKYVAEKQLLLVFLVKLFLKLHINVYENFILKINRKVKLFIGNIRLFPETSNTNDVLMC